MTDRDAVLSANLEFYRAFTTRNFPAMDATWARRLPVSCIHPGWAALRDRASVMQSWRDILANPDAPRLMCHDEEATLFGDIAMVICEEDLGGGSLVATNLFAREDGDWRMIHHQASPLAMPSAQRRATPPGRLN